MPRQFFSIKAKNKEKLKEMDWKLLFTEIFAKHVAQDSFNSSATYSKFLKVKESVYYNEEKFENIFNQIMEPITSIGVFEKREKLLSNKKTLKKLIKGKLTNQDFKQAESFVNSLNSQLKKDTGPIGNYFETRLGQKVMKTLKNSVFIVLPGFGNHVIQEMLLPELVDEINEYYGRNHTRPFIKTLFGDAQFLDYRNYYKRPNRKHQFDVIQPMGKEMGTTTSLHEINGKDLKLWIDNLPDHYASKKIVFLGYSKGATVASHIVSTYSDIRDRTRAIISLGGPLQGSNNAENIIRNIYDLNPSTGRYEFNESLENLPKTSSIVDLTQNLLKNYLKDYPILASLAKNIQNLPPSFRKILQDYLDQATGGDLKDLLGGLYEEGQFYMLDWNLKNLNDQHFDRPIALFNLSFMANLKDFIQRGPITESGGKLPPEIVPQVTMGGINTSRFSADFFFQTLASLSVFEKSPGGLTDTQVAWNDSKFPLLDHLPLKISFNDNELKDIYENNSFKVFFQKNKISFKRFRSMPRKDLYKMKGIKGMHFIDLGEVRGTHWSSIFRQVLRIPGVPEYSTHIHSFPHKSMFKSLIETYAIYQIIRDGE
ncbi:MAG: hypothetical protein DRQ88_01275 [Epsilonproteobacteria bacterium]|nr:MAG: hypothetical protein DRQ89_05345 [Campylobacterota bacterium]RLA67925.1 MAG: hypothetical protein DRQ88_01275 [Campylobacterota bacterium]